MELMLVMVLSLQAPLGALGEMTSAVALPLARGNPVAGRNVGYAYGSIHPISDLQDADSLCAGENAPDSRWSRRHFTMLSHCIFLAPEIQKLDAT